MQSPEDKTDPHLKHWVKKQHFQLMNLPGLDRQHTCGPKQEEGQW